MIHSLNHNKMNLIIYNQILHQMRKAQKENKKENNQNPIDKMKEVINLVIYKALYTNQQKNVIIRHIMILKNRLLMLCLLVNLIGSNLVGIIRSNQGDQRKN